MSGLQEAKDMKTIYKLVDAMGKSIEGMLPNEIHNCIQDHAMIAGCAAIVPVPGASSVATIANIWGMYARINGYLGIKISENILKSIASAVIANLGSFVAVLGVGEALKFIPGMGSFAGAALMAGLAYAVIYVSALIYVKVLTIIIQSGGELNEESILKAVKVVFSTSGDEIKEMLNDAKKSYKRK